MANGQQFGFAAGFMVGTRTDVAGIQTPRRIGTLQDTTLEFGGDMKELYGSFQYPVDTAVGKRKVSGKSKLATQQAGTFNDLFFGETSTPSGQTKITLPPGEAFTPGSGSVNYTVALSGSVPLADQGVYYSLAGTQLLAGSTATGAGVYAFNASTGVYTFSSADIGNGVLVNYDYTVAAGFTITGNNHFMGYSPTFSLTFVDAFEGQQIEFFFPQCKANRLTFPSRLDDYWILEFDWMAFANAAGVTFTIGMPF
jgi:hypothetical protein